MKVFRPNILLVLSDQHRGDWQAHKGAEFLRTPNMMRLAREGVSFDEAICPSPLCVPSRIGLATAQNYGRAPAPDRPLRANADFLPPDIPNIYQRLRDAGYSVGTCGKLDLRKPCRTWGIDGRHFVSGTSELSNLGFTHGSDSAGKHDAVMTYRAGLPEPYFDFLERHGLAKIHADDFAARPYPNYANVSPTLLPEFAYADNFVGARALELIAEMSGTDPWFLQVNFSGPHEPMDITLDMARSIEGREVPVPDVDPAFDRATHIRIRRNYAAMIENIDRWIGDFINVLGHLGELENTIIVYSSDHGEMLGEHGEWAKWVPYRPSTAVPLTVWGGGVPAHADCAPASLIDLGPTLLEFAGAQPLTEVDGVSLVPRIEADRTASDSTFRISGLGRWRTVDTGQYSLIVGYRPGMSHEEMLDGQFSGKCDTPMLFDKRADPGQANNLASDRPDIVRELFACLS